MHQYFWSPERLKKKLDDFSGGQFRMETKEGLVFQGEIDSWEIPDLNKRILNIHFRRLFERRFKLNSKWSPVERWVEFEPPSGTTCLNIEYTTYYFQARKENEKGRENRKERIKGWTRYGEIFRFYKKGDPYNLIENSDGFFVGILKSEGL